MRLPIKPTNQPLTAVGNGSIGLLSPSLFSQIRAITTEQLWGLSDEDACGQYICLPNLSVEDMGACANAVLTHRLQGGGQIRSNEVFSHCITSNEHVLG